MVDKINLSPREEVILLGDLEEIANRRDRIIALFTERGGEFRYDIRGAEVFVSDKDNRIVIRYSLDDGRHVLESYRLPEVSESHSPERKKES